MSNVIRDATIGGPTVQAGSVNDIHIWARTLLSERYQAYEAFCTAWEELESEIRPSRIPFGIPTDSLPSAFEVENSQRLLENLKRRQVRISLLDGEESPSADVLDAATRAVATLGHAVLQFHDRGDLDKVIAAGDAMAEAGDLLDVAAESFQTFLRHARTILSSPDSDPHPIATEANKSIDIRRHE
ncbi:hypothetical protein RM780_10085 [Streptomyces sp. DSM 44917]|uniref:DUF4254 domain-containing protein n=1 Tax=Streptomyces boetiae TaxID=3075541 RepID=A0ABU2L6W3_9ACTN|nr:hypothetical protein [Streptomyces sp. DSM 44917]MDT0307311.1 hypothetical protein [Streptomyces sp. DSM 44917]